MKDFSRNKSVNISKNMTSVTNTIYPSRQNKIQQIIDKSGLNKTKNQDKNKIYSLKMNILVSGSNFNNINLKKPQRGNISNLPNDFSKFIQSPNISDSLRNKFSQVYNQALEERFIDRRYLNKQFTEVKNKYSEFNNNGSHTNYSNVNNFNSKKQELLKILNSDVKNSKSKNMKKIGNNFLNNIGNNFLNNIGNLPNMLLLSPIKSNNSHIRSGSADYIPEKNKDYENIERILKMKSKLEKIIDGEFMITPLIEEGDSFNLRLTKGKESVRDSLLLESSRGGASTRREKRTVSLSSIQGREKDVNFNFNSNFNFGDTSREKEIEKSEKQIKNLGSNRNKEIISNSAHKRARSAYAETLPFKKETLELGN